MTNCAPSAPRVFVEPAEFSLAEDRPRHPAFGLGAQNPARAIRRSQDA